MNHSVCPRQATRDLDACHDDQDESCQVLSIATGQLLPLPGFVAGIVP